MARQDGFVGRVDATEQLLAVLKGERAAVGAVTVCSIEGPGGIGKTALLQHALARADLDALKYLRLRADGGAGVANANVFALAARIVDGAESLSTSKHPAGHYFYATKRVLGLVSEVRKECAAEFNSIVPDDEALRRDFAAVLEAALALGDAINVALPKTKQWLDCSEPSRRRIQEAVLKAHSLKATIRWFGGILPDFWGVEERNAVKADALKSLADALLADLSAVLSGYRPQDRFKPMFPKQDGIDRLLLVIDDYEALAEPLGGFVVRYLIPALGAARFKSVVLILGRDQLQNTDPGWDQHLARTLAAPLALHPLARAEMEQLAEGYGVTDRGEKDRIWNDTLGYPYYTQLWIEEARAGGRTAVMLRRFYERITRWMTEEQKGWLEAVLFLDRVDKETLGRRFKDEAEVDRVYDWFEHEGSVRDTQSPVFRVRGYIRTRLLDYLKTKDPARFRALAEVQ